jgi:hypothetical protein
LEKWKKGRGYGQNNHLLPPLPHDIEQRGIECPASGGWRGAGDPVRGDGREVGRNEEEVEGNSFRSSPWSGTDCGGRSTAAGGLQPRWHGRRWWWRWRAREGGGLVVEVRDEVGSRSGPFIGVGRSVWRGYLSSRSFDGLQWWWGENILALTHRRGFGELGAVGCDASCRFVVEGEGVRWWRVRASNTLMAVAGFLWGGAAAPAAGAGQPCGQRQRACWPG